MLKDIYTEGYMGGLVFTWQDEWFKRTWNTMDLDMPDRRAYWSNTQTNEQEFGVLAFDPGEKKSIVNVDGDISEWSKIKPLISKDNTSVSIASDEKYVYFKIHAKNFNIDKDKFIIPIDSISNQGNSVIKTLEGTSSISLPINLNKNADFLIQIDGQNNSKVLVDGYYDSFYYSYSKLIKHDTIGS